MSKQYGRFLENSDFLITEPDIPRNWYNYLWNDNYITFTSQASMGDGLLQGDLGKRLKLVKDRGFFLLENGKSWGIGGMPVNEKRDAYHCTHMRGATEIYTENYGITSKVTVIVPRDAGCELWQIKVKNESDEKRTIKAIAFCESAFDAAYGRQGYNTEASYYDEQLGGLYIKKKHTFYGGGVAYGFMALSEKCDGFSGRYNAIIGPYGSLAHPVILDNGGCDNFAGCGEKLGFALDKDLTLAPGEEKALVWIAGIALSYEEMLQMKNSYADNEAFEKEKSEVLKKYKTEVDGVSIYTPDHELNHMFEWLKHQTNLGSRWARVRHNGFRDMTSDTDCLAHINPHLALERFKRILTYQNSDGYAPRTFIDGVIRPNNFSDNTVWLNFTAMSILKELGMPEILDIEVSYNDGSVGTIYEHLYRSVDFLYNFRGLNGFIKIWGGDWNDCMNRAGLEGKGVSVWLSLAWYRANKFFAEIAEIHGNKEDAKQAYERGKEMQEIIETYGWDGEYYIDAINDKGVKIGSHENEEGKMFLIPQIWSVFSGVSTLGREVIAMDSVEKYLSDPLGTLISCPAYTKYNPGIGEVTSKHPGIHENGGVYLHTIAWKIAADAMLGRADRVEKDIETILPFRNKVVDGRAEPYTMCNSYFGKQTGYRYGTPGQSWRTASGQWFQKALVNYVFGLMPEMEGLSIKPCLPPSWKTAKIDKKFRNTTYHITYQNNGTKIKSITVNGTPINGNILPLCGGEAEVLVITE